ncbi:MAG: hypothetical protein ACRDYX_14865 [Egibacteraceae bacterium]
MSGQPEGRKPSVSRIRVERDDPLVVSCAACGGVTQLWTYEPVELLFWKVVEHWLVERWDRAGLDEETAS